MEKILSIIIPTYNMEKYLRYCLDSLLINNNFDRLEILVINDGSKDSSSEIAHEYETRFPNVFKVVDKENGNYGSCINKGLAIATGKYVKVLDADDSFDTENFEDFVSYLMSVDADLVLSDFVVVDENREVTSYKVYGFKEGIPYIMDDICLTPSFRNMQMHAVAYRLKNLINMGYRQTEGISYTDQQWIFTPMSRVECVYCYNKPVYKYLVGRAGQTMAVKSVVKYSAHMIPCLEGMLKNYTTIERDVSKSVLSYFHSIITPLLKGLYVEFLIDKSEESKRVLSVYDNNFKVWHKDVYYMIENNGMVSFHIKVWRRCHCLLPILRCTLKRYLSFLRKKL